MAWGKDPFFKVPGILAVKPSPPPVPKLTAILSHERVPTAVIDGVYVSPGEFIHDRRVAAVEDNYVLLEGQDSSLIELVLPNKARRSHEKKKLEIIERKEQP